ncbi:hypothetical protein INT44_002763 [Umbelopsis vinacea]|uniref:S1 motif domain-containing protein n=1 Tax=Umbelopsis vinacea TaxID=44442 RepID=A0A8H7Q4V0_9FUNG|nr:hypothetical protein INT44_002763 [Umbelopsis vinacea]
MDVQILSPEAPSKTNSHKNQNAMDVDGGDVQLVMPGETITSDLQFMRGHGTYLDSESTVISSVAGVVERVNKLISVRALKARYTGEIGDIVVGRITEVAPKRWKVNVNGRQDAILMLSAISLPGGIQRRKNEEDELQMRKFFAEGDMVAAEVQAFFVDGAIGLHTRGHQFSKLRNGSLVVVPSALVQRCKSHFHLLPCGVHLVLGLNGYIWVSKPVIGNPESTDEADIERTYSNKNDIIDDAERESIARVCNCLRALARKFMHINDTIIIYTYEASLKYPVKDLLKKDVVDSITSEASQKLTME